MSGAPFTQGVDSSASRDDGSLRAVFEWQRAILAAGALPELLAAAASPPLAPEPLAVTILLSDPAHELRHLLLGGTRTPAPAGLLFTDSLVATAPQLALISDPWQGVFRATEHGALFPGLADLEQVVLFPLRARGALVGCLNVGTRGRARVPGDGEPWMLAHVSEVMSAALERLLDAMRLRRGGLTNPLTGWHTRRFLEARLKEAIARCERHGGDVSCVLIDIDGLKAVNDAYGQLSGDQALREIAARIEGQLRASDAAAHVEADEFVVLLPDTRVDSARPLAERILDAVRSEPVQVAAGLLLPMSVSIGLASVSAGPGAGSKSLSNHLLAKAESALHLAKSRGGNRYALADV
jgi:two-component system, cell cycle response regulator